MALSLKHSTNVVVADDGVSPVGSDEWNAEHAFTMDSGNWLGRTAAGNGAVQQIATASTPFITQVKITVFSTSGTYTPTSGMKYAIVDCRAGGAGGGAARGLASQTYSGGGGGEGGRAVRLLTAAQIGASQTVTIGGGGAGGSMGGTGLGANGGDTSLGSLVVAKGGVGGVHSASGLNVGTGGAGGGVSGAVGDFIENGKPGGSGFYGNGGAPVMASGHGGGNGGAPVYASGGVATGNNGGQWGGGGSGACVNNAASDGVGGAGGVGCCMITEFI